MIETHSGPSGLGGERRRDGGHDATWGKAMAVPMGQVWMVPLRPNPAFLGRIVELAAIEEALTALRRLALRGS
jgi:hypothetical protein